MNVDDAFPLLKATRPALQFPALEAYSCGQNYKQPYRLSFTEHLPASVENSEEREFLNKHLFVHHFTLHKTPYHAVMLWIKSS